MERDGTTKKPREPSSAKMFVGDYVSRFALRASRFSLRVAPVRIALVAVALLFGLGLAAMPPEGLTHHDTGAKYLQVRNLRLTPGGLDYSINYPARSLDPELRYVPFREKQFYIDYSAGEDYGLIYLQWPIFLGLLTRLPWKVLEFWGLYIVPFLAGVGACWATYRLALALDVSRRIAWVAVPLVGLATPLSIYSLLFFEHTLAAMLVAFSLLFVVKSLKDREWENRGMPPPPRTVLSGEGYSYRRGLRANKTPLSHDPSPHFVGRGEKEEGEDGGPPQTPGREAPAPPSVLRGEEEGEEGEDGGPPQTPGRGALLHPLSHEPAFESRTGDTPVNPADDADGLVSPVRYAWRLMAVGGALLGVAVYFRSELYVLVAVMGLVFGVLALRWREWWGRLFAWLGAFLVALLPLWAFYAITEGALLPLHATWYFAGSSSVGEAAPGLAGGNGGFELPALRYIVKAGWGIIPDFLLGPQSFPSSPIYPVWVGVLGVGGMVLCVLGAVGRGLARRWTKIGEGWQVWVFLAGLAGVGVASVVVALSTQPYHNLHGFVLASPFVAFALWPPERVFTKDGITAQGLVYLVVLAHVGLHTLIISALSGLGPISRHEWGQRYLMSAYPALVVLAMLGARRVMDDGRRATDDGRRKEMRRVWLGSRFGQALAFVGALLVGVGLVFSARGYVVLYSERTQVKSWQELASTLPERAPVVTDDWWLPLNLAPVFYSRPIMLAREEQMSQWAGEMRGRGVAEFGFMSDKPDVFEGDWRESVHGLEAVGGAVEVRGIWMQRFRFGP